MIKRKFQLLLITVPAICFVGAASVLSADDQLSFPEHEKFITSIINKCLKSDITEHNEELIKESQRLINKSNQNNEAWDKEYFSLVSSLQDAHTDLQRFISLTTRIKQLIKLNEQLNTNKLSVREIYRNRLKAVPTAYLLLVRKKADMSRRSRKEIDDQLAYLAKQYITQTFTPTWITSDTKVKNFQVIKDTITATEAGRAESFESDPVRQMSPDEEFFLLQKYRLYPEFPQPGGRERGIQDIEEPKFTDDFQAIAIGDNIEAVPKGFKVGSNMEKLDRMAQEVEQFNALQYKQLKHINNEYALVSSEIHKKQSSAKKELSQYRKNLEKEFSNATIAQLESLIVKAEEALNHHVFQREMLVVTVQSELSQRGENLSDLYAKMVRQAFDDLMKRSAQLKSYKFFVVENHVLKDQEGDSFYSNPIPVEFDVPLRRRTYIPEEGGVYRCGVVLALNVRFSSVDTVTILLNKWSNDALLFETVSKLRRLKKEAKKNNSTSYYKMLRSLVQELKPLAESDQWNKAIANNKELDIFYEKLQERYSEAYDKFNNQLIQELFSKWTNNKQIRMTLEQLMREKKETKENNSTSYYKTLGGLIQELKPLAESDQWKKAIAKTKNLERFYLLVQELYAKASQDIH